MQKELIQQILKFGIVGGIGFLVDGGLLYLLVSGGSNAYFARSISFPIAVVITYYINRKWTFSCLRKDNLKKQVSGYLAVQLMGAAGNYLIYAIILFILEVDYQLIVMMAFAVGSFCGMFINFMGAKFYVFAK